MKAKFDFQVDEDADTELEDNMGENEYSSAKGGSKQMSMKIYFAEISETENIQTSDLMRLVSTEKQGKLNRYRFPIDRNLCLYAELLVRQQAMFLLGLDNDEIEFGAKKYGKPFLRGHPAFHFNISHTQNAIAVAFSDSEIGVDIEKVQPPDFQISKRFFASSEQDYIHSHKNPDRAFYEVWTKKEAYIKCIGTGLMKPLKSFDIFDIKNATSTYMYEMGEYVISVYCKKSLTEEQPLIILTENDLLSSFMKIAIF
jgi:4'-phosphopantetheinyl transferase